MIPSTVIALMKTSVRVATLLASRQADWSPSVAMRRENVVTNAVESAPSAKRSRNMFGARNAVRNASMFLLAPKSDSENDFAQKSEHAAAQNRDADDAGRACAHAFFGSAQTWATIGTRSELRKR